MKKFLFPLSLFLILLSSQLEAQISPCGTNTLAFYDSAYGPDGGSCILGEGSGGVLDFSGFSFGSSINSGSPTLLTDSQITVTPDVVGQGGGFTFTAPNPTTGGTLFTVGVSQGVTYDIDYSFSLVVDPIASGSYLGMDPVTGNVAINQQVCPDVIGTARLPCTSFGVSSEDPPTSVCTLPNDTSPCWENGVPLDVSDSASIANAIDITGDADGGASFDGVTAIVTVSADDAPEPLTPLLGGTGLIAIGLLRRYRRIR